MVERIQAIRGMNDILPDQSALWRFVEQRFAECLSHYGYQEIRFPILENTQLFKRTIGEITDIVEKEMYTFTDLNGDSLSLRPEGTAACVRACLEHGLLHNQQQKLWYFGPMFRHEKPQKGRYRQFHQLGVEVFGIAGAGIDLELIAISKRFWDSLGLSDGLELQINTIGSIEERQAYREVLVNFLTPHFEQLDADSQRRLYKNPLRILDSKNPLMQSLIAEAPKLMDVLSEDSRQHFHDLCQGLEALGIPYTINPFLVRGLDYYGHTVFEWVSDQLGSQGTVCAGGRYDKLVEQLGGNPTCGVGFAIGMERIILLMDTLNIKATTDQNPSLFLMSDTQDGLCKALVLAESLRDDWRVVVHTAGGSFKNQFKKADKSGARLALILGSEELMNETISIKDLRQAVEQRTIPQHELKHYINDYLR